MPDVTNPAQQELDPDSNNNSLPFSVKEVAFGGTAVALVVLVAVGAALGWKMKRQRSKQSTDKERGVSPQKSDDSHRPSMADFSLSSLFRPKTAKTGSKLDLSSAHQLSMARSMAGTEETVEGNIVKQSPKASVVHDLKVLKVDIETPIVLQKTDCEKTLKSKKSDQHDSQHSSEKSKRIMERLDVSCLGSDLSSRASGTLIGTPGQEMLNGFDSVGSNTSSFWRSIAPKSKRESNFYSFSCASSGRLSIDSKKRLSEDVASHYSDWKPTDFNFE